MDDSPSTFYRRQPGYAPTPLLELPALARQAGVARVYVKDESRRPLGSFKSLGGLYAGLRALVRAARLPDIATLVAGRSPARPALLCASDGNHGLAVAAAAELAGTTARVYLPRHVPASRAARIAARGAEVVRVDGTYDEAADEALRAAQRGDGLLIADTSPDPDDPVVADVMAGYGVAAVEIVEQTAAQGWPGPTHFFVQAGAGALAAGMARGLTAAWGRSFRTIVVEPKSVSCVELALRVGRVERLPGDLKTVAEMLSCGEASAPAVRILLELQAAALALDESALISAPDRLSEIGGPATTPSGAAGVAGLLAVAGDSALSRQHALDDASRVLLIVTEGPVPIQADS